MIPPLAETPGEAMAFVPLIASDTTAVIVVGVAAAIAYTALVAIVVVVVFAIGEGDAVADVQHYIDRTEAAQAQQALWRVS